MAKKRSFTINLEYYTVLCVLQIFRLLPRICIPVASQILGSLLWFVLPARRNIITKNLLRAFPEMPYSHRHTLARNFWPKFCSMIIHLIRYYGLPTEKRSRLIEWENLHYYSRAKKENKGIILVSAHFSNWELMGLALCSHGYAHAAVGRPLDNPRINKLINSIRESSNMYVIPHRRAIKENLKLLKNKKSIGLIIDQNFHHGGLFVNFFGTPASMTNLPAVLALKTGSPILPVHGWHIKEKFHIRFDKPILINPAQSAQPSSQELSQQCSDIIEGWIKEKPVYWLWAHDRWKRKPS
ncbi:MAG: lysophospholipid acyltransferase family protein [bacterium]